MGVSESGQQEQRGKPTWRTELKVSTCRLGMCGQLAATRRRHGTGLSQYLHRRSGLQLVLYLHLTPVYWQAPPCSRASLLSPAAAAEYRQMTGGDDNVIAPFGTRIANPQINCPWWSGTSEDKSYMWKMALYAHPERRSEGCERCQREGFWPDYDRIEHIQIQLWQTGWMGQTDGRDLAMWLLKV
ncbi:hypothetical protein GE21DRAFT_2960 [Neurospora crassa]|uniref:Uncharacterized protein n=2 Tax=Neurospora crassa TaxID=5141 RepID=Q1K8L0_NEUCR|nr:hypothetical protein NCU05368 [Neurospora crassa OR74A]EAA34123.1 hypothetical protein NCU05368 [Neurospora crassa OR74A]KHE86412.1 hypothetical protein GE21DRAFT_2960 [Neurospora crassa]CAB91309.2 hypothetical protein [Neurospora crassa]|eukprot:XP_963359.1 hypothetical protein NCU05368 [Neurospora crassa OR74A]